MASCVNAVVIGIAFYVVALYATISVLSRFIGILIPTHVAIAVIALPVNIIVMVAVVPVFVHGDVVLWVVVVIDSNRGLVWFTGLRRVGGNGIDEGLKAGE